MRLLKYAGSASKNLYFTTSLRNSVQSYSLRQSKVLDPADSHPSPPSVFAISCSSHLLLSTSASPPTIYLRNLRISAAPILLQPQCSSSAVVAADFHPESPTIFLLAFADGTLAAYDASRMFLSRGFDQPIEKSGSSGVSGEIGYMQRLHAVGSKVINDGLTAKYFADEIHYDSQIQMSGITAVALVPGHRALAISVGADGKCCVVDFTEPTRTRALLLRTWRLRYPATSLSVVYCGNTSTENQVYEPNERPVVMNKDYRVAIGRRDGKVLLFDLDGQALGKCIVDSKRARVVDVEWAKKETDSAFAEKQSGSSLLAPRRAVSNQGSLGTEVLQRQSPEDDMLNVARGPNSLVEPTAELETTAPRIPKDSFTNVGSVETPILGTSDGSKSISRTEPSTQVGERKDFDRHPDASDTGATKPSHFDLRASTLLPLDDRPAAPPPIPPRPSPKAGGKLSLKRALTARESRNSGPRLDTSSADLRRASTVSGPHSSSHVDTPALQTQKGKPSGPREPPARSNWKTRSNSPAKYVRPTADVNVPLKKHAPDALDLNAHLPPTNGKTSIQSASSIASRTSEESWLSASIESFKTASMYLHYSPSSVSEASNDTVVDWSTPASSRHPLPSPRHSIPQLSNQIPYFQDRSQPPVALPTAAVENVELPGISTSNIDNTTDVAGARAFVPGLAPPPLPKRGRQKKQGHESIDSEPMSASSPSVTSAPSCSSIYTTSTSSREPGGRRHDPIDDTVVQWSTTTTKTKPAPPLRQPPPPPPPSAAPPPPLPARSAPSLAAAAAAAPLRKSPRVPDLSAGVVERSVTAEVLDEGGYDGICHSSPSTSNTSRMRQDDDATIMATTRRRGVSREREPESRDGHDHGHDGPDVDDADAEASRRLRSRSRGEDDDGTNGKCQCRCADEVRNVVQEELGRFRAEIMREMREVVLELDQKGSGKGSV